ncbi:hypothetical protein B0E38_05412 [Streptomyces sp. 111WW2]|nr:hypothetical protein B0E38_05412 [Streptomyces sp. 111WW2]
MIASPPSDTSFHNCAGEVIPPGKRQAMPTIAIGSPASAGRMNSSPASGSSVVSASRVARNAVSSRGVGWSKSRLPGRASPVASARAARSSVVISEVNPSFWNGTRGSSRSPSPYSRTAVTWLVTRSSAYRRRSARPAGTDGTPDAVAGDRTSSAAGAIARVSLRAAASNQCLRRWNAYVGSGTERPPASAWTARQSTSAPRTNAVATAVSSVRVSGRPARSVGVASASELRTASGPTSRRTVAPSSPRVRTASAKRTACRTWSVQ